MNERSSPAVRDKVAVVTGAGRGVGMGVAFVLAGEGAKVVVNNDIRKDLNGVLPSPPVADLVVEEIRRQGGTAVANYDSVSSSEGGRNIIGSAVDNFGRIDILVNVAGNVADHMIYNMTDEEWDSVLKVHLYGTFYCTRAACVLMKQQRSGTIVNMTSLGAFGNIGMVNYCAAKAGVIGLTKAVALEMGKYGVTCNAIIPTAATRISWSPEIETLWRRRAEAGEAFAQAQLEEVGLAEPEDNGPLVAYLAGPYGKNINGALFHVRPGRIELWGDQEPIKTIYHSDRRLTGSDLADIMPKTIAAGLINPSPPQEPGEKYRLKKS
ncbi:SDR family NAD(P)-dependent oxidoreductase [Thermodesulfobacteriota bacterium]